MDDFSLWFYELQATTDWQSTFAGLAFVVSLIALWYSYRSSRAAERSADASENANAHAEKSAVAAKISSNVARASFENEAKRVKASAYWTLYRIHGKLESGWVPDEKQDLSAVQDLLSVYPHAMNRDQLSAVNTAIDGIELWIAKSSWLTHDDAPLVEKVRHHVRDAAMAIKEDWMAIGAIQDEAQP